MEFKNGQFVRLNNKELGVIVNDKIVYQDGEYDKLSDFDNNGIAINKAYRIIAIYNSKCFLDCIDENKIWQLNQSILDKEEKEYLSAVIKPFRNEILSIEKVSGFFSSFISFNLKSGLNGCLPPFKKDTMYKNMKDGKEYTLEELGL